MDELDDAELDETGPERTCVVTRRKGQPDDMIRFVAAPDGTVVPDLKRKLPGRGVWVTASAATVAEAVKKGSFARGLRAKVNASATLAAEVEALMERDALQFFSFANKAGLLVTGFAKVEKAVAAPERIAGLVHASDAGDDGIRKMGQVLLRRYGEAALKVPRVILFTSSQLDLALGRTNVIHAALKTGAAVDAFLSRSRRLALFRGLSEPGTAGGAETEHGAEPEHGSVSNSLASGLGPGIRSE